VAVSVVELVETIEGTNEKTSLAGTKQSHAANHIIDPNIVILTKEGSPQETPALCMI